AKFHYSFCTASYEVCFVTCFTGLFVTCLRTTIFCPSKHTPSSDKSCFTTSPTCSGCIIVLGSSSGANTFRNSVAQRPGEIQYTRIPYSDSSSDNVCDILMMAALDEAYASQPGRAELPAVEATFRICPPVFFIHLTVSFVMLKIEWTLMLYVFSQSSIDVSSNDFGFAYPATLINISIVP